MTNSQSWLKIIGKVEKVFSPVDSTSPKTNVSWDLENQKKKKKKSNIYADQKARLLPLINQEDPLYHVYIAIVIWKCIFL